MFLTEGGKQVRYRPEELLAYQVEDDLCKTHALTAKDTSGKTRKEGYFFKVLESGRIDFLYVRDEQSDDRYFIIGDDKELHELVNTESVTHLNSQYRKKI